ncbi:MAG: xylulokinase, partial [Clostridia bacterium]|nr:xylulokinase [Clostridia bacterium]
MKYYVGIDLGTSAVKLILMEETGQIAKTVSKKYPLSSPQPSWSEQAPEDWWKGVVSGLKELLEGLDPRAVEGIGVGGQMHGLVLLDENDEVLRPAILWNDTRTGEETDFLND